MVDSLWKIKELEKYEKKLKSDLPPYYDFSQVRVTHQEIEANILEYWEFLHPVIQDLITSWFILWINVKKEIDKLVAEKEQKNSALSSYKRSSETKVQGLTNKVNIQQSELEILKQELLKKEQKIQEMEEKDKDNRYGIAELRAELEKQLAELSLKLSEMQTRFETTQSQVTRAFENRVMVFESEVVSMKEQIKLQEEKIPQLRSENEELIAQNKELDLFEENVGKIVDIVTSISYREE